MKKLALWITLLSILLWTMIPIVVIAETKSLAQLQEEYISILQAMWKTKEWKSVKVPSGTYKVGEEIPEGEWKISLIDTDIIPMAMITIGTKLNKTKTEIDGYQNQLAFVMMVTSSHPNGWTVNLEEGVYIILSNPVIFSTPVKGEGFTFE